MLPRTLVFHYNYCFILGLTGRNLCSSDSNKEALPPSMTVRAAWTDKIRFSSVSWQESNLVTFKRSFGRFSQCGP